MKIFITALPLFDYSMSVNAYQLSDMSGDTMLGLGQDFRRMTGALRTPGLDLIREIGLEPFTGEKPLFVEINKFQLIAGQPESSGFTPDKFICVIPGDAMDDVDVLIRCKLLRDKGYFIAAADFPGKGADDPIAPLLDFVLLNYQDVNFKDTYKKLKTQLKHVRAVVTNLPNRDTFNALSSYDRSALFTGSFYSQPITEGGSVLSPVKVNVLHLLNQVNQEDFDLADIVKIIERDPYLTISLLRFINSGAKVKKQIDSISQAVAILGQKEVRRWATIALSVNLGEDRPSEITKLSLVRAKFAENLAGAFELGTFQSGLFMAGLFSLLDVILEKPMPEAIREVGVDERVRRALVEHGGELYPVLDLIYYYERADWNAVTVSMIKNNIELEAICGAFVDALVWYSQLLRSIDENDDVEDAARLEAGT